VEVLRDVVDGIQGNIAVGKCQPSAAACGESGKEQGARVGRDRVRGREAWRIAFVLAVLGRVAAIDAFRCHTVQRAPPRVAAAGSPVRVLLLKRFQ
jgi:hypothetical protein